eukprot:CAMPEP_0197725560 /NCGR_PEP_ID=MMETSP1434-20131217/7372_1 /TAXON_ID=265543 /ORGANISM="Minutocellus polymorphus, Strain CCMP3303" /LENGTH=53 /DNA_ID=CAMNT_0043311063 /DNA_START=18 /DNA_END=176 /DNA_ORIENTATION=+
MEAKPKHAPISTGRDYWYIWRWSMDTSASTNHFNHRNQYLIHAHGIQAGSEMS